MGGEGEGLYRGGRCAVFVGPGGLSREECLTFSGKGLL